ncbi:MAG: M3 family metallopeptidase [Flavobacteriales bacterium]|nr:M3 family metallopeptidase [Flavobacteriales bacterium]
MNNISNPLLEEFKTPYNSAPFNDIKTEYFKDAILQLIEKSKEEINVISESDDNPTFSNTIEAFENVGKQLNRVTSIFFNLHSAETNDEIQIIAQEISPILAEYSNDILFNQKLFSRIKTVYDNQESFDLNTEQRRLLEINYKSFVENGALLSDEKQLLKRELDNKLTIASLKFGENVLHETNNYFLHIENKNDLYGLPESYIDEAKKEAKNRNLDGFVFTLQYPSYIPFMKYVKNREFRKELYLANGTKAFKDNEYNNATFIEEIAQIRQEKAELLGFSTHAELTLINRMAKNTSTVINFLEDLLEKSFPFAQKEVEKLKEIAKQEDNIDDLQAYDHAYYSEKLKEKTFDFNEEAVRPYFSLEKTLKAVFDLSNQLFGLEFTLKPEIQTYNGEVNVYEVTEKGEHKALLYTDFFPRKGKRAGAWMTSYKNQYKQNGKNHRPHVSIVCNFTRPTDDTPSLLNFQEVTTLFHEFGHALHGILANTQYESLSGTSVYWDFVELPSQFLENYCYEKEFLQTFAHHYQTGELLPEDVIDKIIASSNFMEAYQTVRQVGLGLLDMKYHTGKLPDDFDVESFEKKTLEKTKLYPAIDNAVISSSFSHIFQGGYSAGYYSYKWSEVLDADAFYYFKENGIFNPEIASKFKTLLSKGGTENPVELYKQFRGKDATNEALLKRAGIVK